MSSDRAQIHPAGKQAAMPVVSVVIATYNRSYTLRHAIQSVRGSTLTDWELLVIGDACTDDTAECVASFGDPRIRFLNLTARCGDQSGPNNQGVAMARGRYVAFLNHDDFYLPDHLAGCVAELEASGADFVWAPCALATPKADAVAGDWPCEFTLTNVPANQSGYSPFGFYFASSWVFRRELAERVGPWTKGDRLHAEPSQDWLFRAWRAGAVLRFRPVVSVIIVPAGYRRGSYVGRESPDHEWLARWLKDDPKCREQILGDAAVNEAMRHLAYRVDKSALAVIGRVLLRPVYALLLAMNIHPRALSNVINFGRRRGSAIRDHRKTTGAK